MDWVNILSPFAAVITAAVGWYLAESIRSKNKAEATKALTDAATDLVEMLRDEILQVKAERNQLKLYVIYLMAGIAKLSGQLKETPTFIPQTLEEFQKQNTPPS